jgi:hypothetical protein
MSLYAELRRRNIFKVALLYLVAGWFLLEIADLVFVPIGVPDWVYRFTTGMWIICFPLALVFSWIYEITPEGLKREREVAPGKSITRQTGQRINRLILILLGVTLLLMIAKHLLSA